MATIRKQAIISGILMYVGFAVGALNVYLFTHFFHPEQYGLTRSYMDFGQTMFAFGSFGTVSVLYKFSPYYISNLSPNPNPIAAIPSEFCCFTNSFKCSSACPNVLA